MAVVAVAVAVERVVVDRIAIIVLFVVPFALAIFVVLVFVVAVRHNGSDVVQEVDRNWSCRGTLRQSLLMVPVHLIVETHPFLSWQEAQ